MILQALTRYYETMLKRGEIAPPGWDDGCRVSYGLELDEDGSLLQLIPFKTEQQRGKKVVLAPQAMKVPAHAKRSVDITANFLCDNAIYMMGVDAKGKPERAKKCFAANAELHRDILSGVDTPAAQAILRFFEKWDPAAAEDCPLLEEAWKDLNTGANLIFCYGMKPVTQDSEIAAAWQQHYNAGNAEADVAPCLVTGRVGAIATLHPAIKGVRNAQSMGASLVSFNAPAFESYGHTQGENAPVSEYAAFAYGAALNALLADRAHCGFIGDTTVVCWAEHGDCGYQDVSMGALFGPQQGITQTELRAALDKLAHGQRCHWSEHTLDPEEHFYFLGLAPNAARLSVRFFLQDTMGDFMQKLEKHYQDIAIVRPAFDQDEDLPLWKLLDATVNQRSNNKAPTPQLAGDMLRSILTGALYPATLLNGAALRIRAEHTVTRARAAIIKGYYTRYGHFPKEVLQMSLNEQSTNIPYVLGRMFSIYEQIQQGANSEIKATIKDKYFNAASGTPATIFPLLGNLAEKHLRVIRRTSPGLAVNFTKKLGEFAVIIGESYPSRLDLPSQGAFQLGYYFETQKHFTKKEALKEDTNNV